MAKDVSGKSKVKYFRDEEYQWRWHVVAPNGKIIATCGEGYHNLEDARDGYRKSLG